MKKTQQEKRLFRYRKSDDATKKLYASEKLGESISSTIEQASINTDKVSIINCFGDAILGFYKTSDIPELLQKEVGLSADDTQRIFSDLKEFLAPVIEREKNEVDAKRVEMKELEQTFNPQSKIEKTPEVDVSDNSVSTNKKEAPKEPPTPEQNTPPTQPVGMRTMETDMNRIHGYGAYRAQFPEEATEVAHKEDVIRSVSQEELLAEKPPLADMPTYEDGDEDVKE